MTDYKIPDEMVEAAAEGMRNEYVDEYAPDEKKWADCSEPVKACWRFKARAALTAAFAAAEASGMAKKGFGYPFADDRPDNWIADSHLCKADTADFPDLFPVLIVKLEPK